MQKLSKEALIFVDVEVETSRPRGELAALLKRCKVRRLPAAAITDQYGNLLYPSATTKDPDTLKVQAAKAKLNAEKIKTFVTQRYEKAREYCKTRKYSAAAMTLARVKKEGWVGFAEIVKADQLYSDINRYLEGQLRKIREARATEDRKREAIKTLRAQAYKDLPVYAKIEAAYQEMS
jgi:hypothetical protein